MSVESARQWRLRNPERSRALTKASYEKHREVRLAKKRQDNQRRKAEHRARLDAIKMAAGCTDCGYAEHPAALDFDHIGDDKSFGIGVSVHRRWSLIEAEIAKCEIVCANCHRIRTYTRWQDQCVADAEAEREATDG